MAQRWWGSCTVVIWLEFLTARDRFMDAASNLTDSQWCCIPHTYEMLDNVLKLQGIQSLNLWFVREDDLSIVFLWERTFFVANLQFFELHCTFSCLLVSLTGLWSFVATLLDFAVILQLLTVKKYSKIPYIWFTVNYCNTHCIMGISVLILQ